MFCYQCEQTSHGSGCTEISVCGKDHPTAALQDLLVHITKGISVYAHEAAQLGARDRDIDVFVLEALFTTVTNVNFDYASMRDWIDRGVQMRDRARALYEQACKDKGSEAKRFAGAASYDPPKTSSEGVGQAHGSVAQLVRDGERFSITAERERYGEDIGSLLQLYTYGLKGAAAYADHAQRLGKDSAEHYAKYHEALAYLAAESYDFNDLLGRCLAAGAINLEAMELLDAGNTESYGHPEPTEARIEPIKGKAILVSGHDLRDLKDLCEQTKDKGVNIYTHGEMLPALAYPEFKKYPHLIGNYGGAWQDQIVEFSKFPGAILMTTNCIQKPKSGYYGRIFTTGMVAWPGVSHVEDRDFTPVIEAALAAPGFEEDGADDTITIGFAHNAVLGAADAVVEAVKSGAIKHFFLVGGCDGAKSGRNYYTEFAEAVPNDCMILTLACGKFRFNKKQFGAIGGIPRLLDMGQCNDAYSAVQVAVALAKAFDCGVNDLPLSLTVSWFEQKAVAILLTLLHLGIEGVRLGPSLPAFVSPKVLGILVEKFKVQTNSEDAKADVAAALAG
jgi:hydroxylamine reductase